MKSLGMIGILALLCCSQGAWASCSNLAESIMRTREERVVFWTHQMIPYTWTGIGLGMSARATMLSPNTMMAGMLSTALIVTSGDDTFRNSAWIVDKMKKEHNASVELLKEAQGGDGPALRAFFEGLDRSSLSNVGLTEVADEIQRLDMSETLCRNHKRIEKVSEIRERIQKWLSEQEVAQ